jgi:hypothetical protein
MAKLHDLGTWLAIDRAILVLDVVRIHNEEEIFN